jgi:hypothetical protein
MRREIVLQHLRLAEDHVELGMRHIDRQRELIARLEGRGLDTVLAESILEVFRQTQQLHEEDRDRLLRELARLTP